MPEYREKLLPSPWVFIATALVIPASILVFAPISMPAGIMVAIVLFASCVGILVWSSPVIEIDRSGLRAGTARIDLGFLGEPVGFEGPGAVAQRGTRLDARAHLVIRGWIDPVVRIPIDDPADPTPYWLLSTRHPNDVVAAIRGSRRREGTTAGSAD